MSNADRGVLAGWQSLAQWVGTRKGAEAVRQVAERWPGYERHAQRSTLNAYYTAPGVIDAVWNFLERSGVVTGHGFEPGVGRGDWIAEAPAAITFDAVDIDPISVAVAQARTGANVVESTIEEWDVGRSSRLGTHGYDVVVGNVPFAAYRPALNNPHRDNLHNLAIGRSVAMLRPGGIAAVLTSRYTLDSRNADFRERLAGDVDLVVAYRLPTGTHREAGTEVVTDLLILRRPAPGEARPDPTWLVTSAHSVEGDDGSVDLVWNAYWDHNPDHILGRIEPGGAYRADDFHVRADRSGGQALAEALASAPTVDYAPSGGAPAQAGAPVVRTATGRRLPAGSIVVDPASPTGFTRDTAPHPCAAKNAGQLAALCGMRDAALEYLDAPSEEGRSELLGLYLDYRAEHAPLNWFQLIEARVGDDVDEGDGAGERVRSIRRYPRLEGFRRDPSWWNVAALETFDHDTMDGSPAPLLLRDTVTATTGWPGHADDVTHAAIHSLARHHRLDVEYIANQLDVSATEATSKLAAVAFETPEGEWELSERYLSGDVVGKLDAARSAAITDQRFARNVDALTAVLPTQLTAAEISAEFGVPWLDPADVGAFIAAFGGGEHATVRHHAPSGTWSVEGFTPAGPSQFHRERKTLAATVIDMCNGAPATVWTEIEVGDRYVRVVDTEDTAAEQLARENLTEALQGWVWSDPERSERLVARYNHMFNRHVAETWDGSHLTLPGLSSEFTPRPHQRDIVWRILASRDTGVLMAHGVGAGKTAAMVIAGAEARRTGRVPGTTVYAVPGNMVEQFAGDYLALYPAARVITPQGANLTDATREFAARVATGDFDAAICSHNVLKRIPLSPTLERSLLEARITEFESSDPAETLSRAAAKRAARRLAVLQEKLAALRDAAEDEHTTYWDRMGVGMLFVDEAHLAKNIVLGTERQGLPIPEGSQVAEAILARADVVRSHHGEGAVVMATATPVTNSPAEMWVMARLVAPGALANAGISRFDPFAANFLSPIDTVELDAGGRLRVVTRLGEYRNFPDLARIFRSFTDVRPTSSLGFALPQLAGGEANVHVVEPTDQQLTAAAWARERAERKHLHLAPDERDPAIAIMTMNKLAALHPGCVSSDICTRWATLGYPDLHFTWDEPSTKLAAVADQVAAIHHRTADWTYPSSATQGAAQVVFCDLGTPKPGEPSAYSILTKLLVERGVERSQIAWVHDIAEPGRRQPLWDAVRNGHTRVLIGSTAQMGVGVNIQTRLYAIHEVTTPITGRPDALEQGEGRMIRQGNHHDVVELHRYVTERTADVAGWQMLHRKQRFITQAMSDPDTLTRDLRDESVASPAEEFAQIAAIATGNVRHVQLAALTSTVTRLERASRAHHSARTNQDRNLRHNTARLGRLEGDLAKLTALRPTNVEDPSVIGTRLLAVRSGSSTSVNFGSVSFDITRRYEELTIAFTALEEVQPVRVHGDALRPQDGGRGLGTRIVNLIDRIPSLAADVRARIDAVGQQIDADTSRPVPIDFPRQHELDQARAERDRLTSELLPARDQHSETAAHNPEPAAPAITVSTAGASGVALDAWARALRSYDPRRGPSQSTCAGMGEWASWAHRLLRSAPIDANARHDLGRCRGVALVGSHLEGGLLRVEASHPFVRSHEWPAYLTSSWIGPGDVDAWLVASVSHAAQLTQSALPTPTPAASACRATAAR